MRVVNGSNRCSGRVEVHDNGNWKKLCSDDGSGNNADVVCREINCSPPVAQAKVPYFGEGPKLDSVKSNCFGNESSFSQCTLQETTDICPAATVVCKRKSSICRDESFCIDLYVVSSAVFFFPLTDSRPIRLMNGTGRCSGRMEIYHDGQWGTICDDRWGMQEATVVCQELNCGSALSIKYNAHFGRGHGQVWLDDVDCTGHEKSLSDCPHRGFGEHDCDHNEDASVICSGNNNSIG